MARYYFDVRDGDRLVRDERGLDLPDAAAIWTIALPMVDEIGAADLHLRRPGSVAVLVRDASGVVVYRSDRAGRGSERGTDRPAGDARAAPDVRRCASPLLSACPFWRRNCRASDPTRARSPGPEVGADPSAVAHDGSAAPPLPRAARALPQVQ